MESGINMAKWFFRGNSNFWFVSYHWQKLPEVWQLSWYTSFRYLPKLYPLKYPPVITTESPMDTILCPDIIIGNLGPVKENYWVEKSTGSLTSRLVSKTWTWFTKLSIDGRCPNLRLAQIQYVKAGRIIQIFA